MKKSLVIKHNTNKTKELPEQFTNYFPGENGFEKISTLGLIEYDYLYITNFEKSSISDFAKIFNGNSEHFFIEAEAYDDRALENACIAHKNSNYSYKIGKNDKKESKLEFIGKSDILNYSTVVAESISLCKDMINTPSNIQTITGFSKALKDLADSNNIQYLEINKEELITMGAGGILAVNQGSLEDAKVVRLKYNGSPSNKLYTIVGKGLIFDTGGYSLKGTQSIVTMKSDMGGAATAASVINAIAKLNLKINLEVIIPITDNLISEKSYRPDDIITFMNGITTEIISTDAEGRLILADSLVMANKEKPELIIDIATLTGAVVAALGDNTTGVFGNDDKNIENIIKCTHDVGEYAWHLPINDTHREQIKGTFADLKNSASPAGASTAAAFLEKFIGDSNWIHLDIAGTSWNKVTGATGAMVHPLVKFFKEVEEK